MASVAQSVECWSRDPGSRVQFPAEGLGVVFFTTGPGWVLNVYLFDTRIYLTLIYILFICITIYIYIYIYIIHLYHYIHIYIISCYKMF